MNDTNNDGMTPLMIAAMMGRYDMLNTLLMVGADPSIKSNEGKTFWDYLSEEKQQEYTKEMNSKPTNLEVAKATLSKEYFDQSINSKNDEGNTPLALGCLLCHVGDSLFMIENGADVNIKNNFGLSPLDLAKRFPHPDSQKIIDVLVAVGAESA